MFQKHQNGLERLGQVVSQHWSRPAEEIKKAVVGDVRQFIGKQKVYDDLTLLVIKQK
jgi:sigma-B regulation protein RsbU (phosphoserine phosphatase)